jgi:hypothetical protein
MRLVIPGLKLESEANRRDFWATKAKRVKSQKLAVRAAAGWSFKAPSLPLVVVIIRHAPRDLDSDNATGSAKHVRDQLAELLGVDDRSPEVSWFVVQRRAKAPWVEIRIVPRCPGCGVCRLTLPGVCALAELSAETPS